MTEISIAGETFHLLIEGDENRPVLMLAHPLGANLHIWDPQISALLGHFRTVRYDSRGHGASVANKGPYSIEGLGRDALAILDALAIEKVHWLGLSLGSAVGLWLLTHARERIGRAVLANTAAHIPGPDVWNSRIQSARESGMDAVALTTAERWFTKTFRETHPERVVTVREMVRTTPLRGYLAACAAMRDMDQREAIRSISNKVLVIAGRHDPSTPPGMGALVANSIQGAKFVTLDASHIANIEDEANFTKAALEFLTAPETVTATPSPRRKAPAKKAVAKKVPAKKTPAKKAAPEKAPPQPHKKAAARTSSRQRVAAKKATVKKTSGKTLQTKGRATKAAAKRTTVETVSKKRTDKKKKPGKRKS